MMPVNTIRPTDNCQLNLYKYGNIDIKMKTMPLERKNQKKNAQMLHIYKRCLWKEWVYVGIFNFTWAQST